MEDWKTALGEEKVDVEAAITRFGGKEDRYIKYLKLFYKDENFNTLLSSIEKTDVKTAFESCHALKGVTSNLGFTEIFDKLYEACEILRAGKLEGVPELVVGIKGNYERILNVISDNLM